MRLCAPTFLLTLKLCLNFPSYFFSHFHCNFYSTFCFLLCENTSIVFSRLVELRILFTFRFICTENKKNYTADDRKSRLFVWRLLISGYLSVSFVFVPTKWLAVITKVSCSARWYVVNKMKLNSFREREFVEVTWISSVKVSSCCLCVCI